MEEKKKSNKGLIVLVVVLLVLVVGLIGFTYYGYTKYSDVNNMYSQLDKKYNNLNNKYTKLNKDYSELNNKYEETNKTVNQVTNKNDYNLFVNHMKKVREQYEQIHSYGGDKLYGVTLTKNGELSINNSSRKVIKIADNVLLFKAMIIPELSINGLCYVTEDGFVYVADIERAFEDGSNVKITKQKYAKEIVNIISIPKPDKIDPAFIDINGNLYTYSY